MLWLYAMVKWQQNVYFGVTLAVKSLENSMSANW